MSYDATDGKDIPAQEEGQVTPLQLHQYRSFWRTALLVANVCLASFYFGYSIIYLNVIDFRTIILVFDVRLEEQLAQGLLTFCIPLGGLIGSALSSLPINHLSRRSSLLVINAAAVVIGCLILLANMQALILLRICQGICAGMYSAIVPLIIKQLAPKELSGILGVFHQLFITIGIFFACFFYYLLTKITNDLHGVKLWQFVFAVPIVTVLVQTIVLCLVPYETPVWLLSNNHHSQAKKLVTFIYHERYVQEVLTNLSKDINHQQQNTSSVSHKVLKIPILVACHLAILQQCVGISVVMSYAREIASGNLHYYKALLPSIINFEGVIAALLSSFLLGSIGRKPLLQAGTVGSMVTNSITAVGFFLNTSYPSFSNALILFGIFTFIASFGLSLGPIIWLYIPQIVPPKVLPYSTMINWGSSALLTLLFPIVKKELPHGNPAAIFLFFALWSCASYFFNRKYVIETKGKDQTNINEQYKRLEICTN